MPPLYPHPGALAQSVAMAPEEVLVPTAMASDGRAVARSGSGKVVFVEGALPGETVTVEVLEDRARYSGALVVDVLEAAPERIAPPCPRLVDGCGGCQWQHISAEGQVRLKESMIADSLARIGHVATAAPLTTVTLEPWSWRTTIRAAVSGGRAALRQARTHSLVPIEGCLIAHPLLVPLLTGERYGDATSVVLRCGARTGERLAAPTPGRARMDVPDDVRSDRFHEQAAGRRWRVSAGSFFQSRPDGADALAALVKTAASELATRSGDRRAVDAYSGVGLFAGVLAEDGWSVVALEGSRSSVEDSRANLRGLPVQFVRTDVTRWRPMAADLVVADPSRAGLGRAGVEVLAGTSAERIVLISCDVASLGRDTGLLVGSGYRQTSVTAVDMFPQTWHVEVVSVFDRGGRD